MATDVFELPQAFDLAATFFFALTGALKAIERRYDFVGAFTLAFVTGVGGGLLRDVLLQRGPPVALVDERYLAAVALAGVVGVVLGERLERLAPVITTADALGLGLYAVVGTQRTFEAGLGGSAAVVIGVLNAVGGGLLRDVLVRSEPFVFRPGQLYAAAALAGSLAFVLLSRTLAVAIELAALGAIAVGFTLRAISVRYDWRTTPLGRRPLAGREG